MTYRWPSKLKRFGITDPSLRMLVAKHENEIPWQVTVRNEADLTAFVAEHMLPRQLQRIALPFEGTKKHCFVLPKHVDLELALATDQTLDEDDVGILSLICDENGPDEARRELARIVNARKAIAFDEWKDLLTGRHGGDPAFAILLLRPLLAMTGSGSRRTVLPASADIADWLRRRLVAGRLSPNDNFGKLYAWRMGAGAQHPPLDGWQHVRAGRDNATQLAAAAAGSGWCVTSQEYAREYLTGTDFYILRHEGAPVVALRTTVSGCVLEIQGRHNLSPVGWHADIDLFVRSQGFAVSHYRWQDELEREMATAGPFEDRSRDWWLQRVRYWPFAASLAPARVGVLSDMKEAAEIAPYIGFTAFDRLLRDSGIVMSKNDWIVILGGCPQRYESVPIEYREDADIVAACIANWTERVREGDVTLGEARDIPDIVRRDKAFNALLEKRLLGKIERQVRRRPSNARERRFRFDLDKTVPPSSDESREIAIERVVSRLLANETADFSDAILSDEIRAREDFATVREAGWREVIEAHPPMWFALPTDLAGGAGFVPSKEPVTRVDLEAWVAKVTERPWLLTQQRGVPKSVRFHRRLLEAYFDGWMQHLEKAPWRIWVLIGQTRRVYMSYALLAAPDFPDAFSKAWRRRNRTPLDSAWGKRPHGCRRWSATR